MDETPMYFDMCGDSTYTETGAKDVLKQSSGHDKMRYTVVLTVSGIGKKLKPMIIFRNLKSVPKLNAGEKWPEGIYFYINYCNTSCMFSLVYSCAADCLFCIASLHIP
jgi:hypothetical protein